MSNEGGMINVGDKEVTVRTAKARGVVALGEKAFKVVKDGTCVKGDVFTTAKIAAIQAVKSTPGIIPLCHTLIIEHADTEFTLNEIEKTVTVDVMVRSTGKTGVEMEALTGAAAACLTIYDMLKYVGRDMVIQEIKLMEKSGGKSGLYKRHD